MTPNEPPIASSRELDAWERAYVRFQSPAEEVRKFRRRLIAAGALEWPRNLQIVEICSGRGGGLRALRSLGFTNIEGLDLSRALAATYRGPGTILIGDCRCLPFPDRSRDVLVVQGGLHHLAELPRDLERTLSEAVRVLREGGRFVMVEPWQTPFLRLAHATCRSSIARKLSSRVDALAAMIDLERPTYEQWLSRPDEILDIVRSHLAVESLKTRWGKLLVVARPRV